MGFLDNLSNFIQENVAVLAKFQPQPVQEQQVSQPEIEQPQQEEENKESCFETVKKEQPAKQEKEAQSKDIEEVSQYQQTIQPAEEEEKTEEKQKGKIASAISKAFEKILGKDKEFKNRDDLLNAISNESYRKLFGLYFDKMDEETQKIFLGIANKDEKINISGLNGKQTANLCNALFSWWDKGQDVDLITDSNLVEEMVKQMAEAFVNKKLDSRTLQTALYNLGMLCDKTKLGSNIFAKIREMASEITGTECDFKVFNSYVSENTGTRTVKKTGTATKKTTSTGSLVSTIKTSVSNLLDKVKDKVSNNGDNVKATSNPTVRKENTNYGLKGGKANFKISSSKALSTIKTALSNGIKSISKTLLKNAGNADISTISNKDISSTVEEADIKGSDIGSDNYSGESLGDLEASKGILSDQIESDTEALEAITSGSDSRIANAQDIMDNNIETYLQALDFSNNPIIKGIKDKISTIDDCISQSILNIASLDHSISDVNGQIAGQTAYISDLSGTLTGCDNQIQELKHLQNQGADSDYINKVIDILKNAKKAIKEKIDEAREQKTSLGENLTDLRSQKRTCEEGLAQYRSAKNEAQKKLIQTKNELIEAAYSLMKKSKEQFSALKSKLEKDYSERIASTRFRLSNVEENITEFEQNMPEETSLDAKKSTSFEKPEEEKQADFSLNASLRFLSDGTHTPDSVEEGIKSIDDNLNKEMAGDKDDIQLRAYQIGSLDNTISDNQYEITTSNVKLEGISDKFRALIKAYSQFDNENIESLDKTEALEIKASKLAILTEIGQLEDEQRTVIKEQEEAKTEKDEKTYQQELLQKEQEQDAYDYNEAYFEAFEEIRKREEEEEEKKKGK